MLANITKEMKVEDEDEEEKPEIIEKVTIEELLAERKNWQA